MRKSCKDAKQVVVELRPARAKATLAELLMGWIRKPVKVRVKR